MGEVWRAEDSKIGREYGRCRTSASMPGKPFLMGIEGGSCFVAGKSGIFKGFDGICPGD
jgi:hypothetical protein